MIAGSNSPKRVISFQTHHLPAPDPVSAETAEYRNSVVHQAMIEAVIGLHAPMIGRRLPPDEGLAPPALGLLRPHGAVNS